MSDGMPADVRATLEQLFEEARVAAKAGETDLADTVLESAGTVVETKLPAGQRRDRFDFGCRSAREALPEGDLAAAYVEAMERRLPEA